MLTVTLHKIYIAIKVLSMYVLCTFQILGGLSGSEDRGGGDNSIQFINFGRVGGKSFEERRQKVGGGRVGDQQYLDFFVLLY